VLNMRQANGLSGTVIGPFPKIVSLRVMEEESGPHPGPHRVVQCQDRQLTPKVSLRWSDRPRNSLWYLAPLADASSQQQLHICQPKRGWSVCVLAMLYTETAPSISKGVSRLPLPGLDVGQTGRVIPMIPCSALLFIISSWNAGELVTVDTLLSSTYLIGRIVKVAIGPPSS
jgi:hypothetical protein